MKRPFSLRHTKASKRLAEALTHAYSDKRDSHLMRLAAKRMDRMRERNRRKFGTSHDAVTLIREARD